MLSSNCYFAKLAASRDGDVRIGPLDRLEFLDDDRLGKAGFGPFLEGR
jgi:hypothetical protein